MPLRRGRDGGRRRWRPEDRERPPVVDVRRVRFAQLFAIFTLVGLVSIAPAVLQRIGDGQAIDWPRLASEMVGWYLWVPFVPPILWLVRHFPLERTGRRRGVAIYLGFGFLVALVYGLLDLLKTSVFFLLTLGTRAPSVRDLGIGYLFGGIQFYLLVYAAILAVLHAFEYHRRFRDRDVKAARLESQLVETKLQVLRGQLNPHFLFNTLNAVSALMYKDVDAADRMIVQLSEFLRMTLESGSRQEVTLGEELEILDHYVEIERTRFGERLRVEFDVEPELLDARVPTLLLQPLVENAVRHGLATRSAPGLIEVRARPLYPGRLELRVRDNGVGLQGDADALVRPGVGLHNTLRRLEQLYGEDQRFEIGNAREGGTEVRVELPLHRLPIGETEESTTPASGVSAAVGGGGALW